MSGATTAMPQWVTYIPVVSAGVAALAFGFSVLKQWFDRSFSRETDAKKVWRDYLTLAFDHPEFASGLVGERKGERFERYEWFVARMLFAAEEVLHFSRDNREWRKAIETQVAYHCDYFCGEGDPYIGHYAPILQDIIKRVCACPR